MFDQLKFERLAVNIVELAEKQPLETGVDVMEAGKAAGLTEDECRVFATAMQEDGLGRFRWGPPHLFTLSIKGHLAIAQLRRPRWQRWLEKQLFLSALCSLVAIVLSVIGIVIGLVSILK